MAQVTKQELIELVRRKAEKTYSKAEVDDVLTSFSEVLTEELENGNTVTLKDVGTWEIVVREARTARNPRTGESIEVPEKTALHFKASVVLKRAIAELDPDKFRKGESDSKQRDSKQAASDKKPVRKEAKRGNRR